MPVNIAINGYGRIGRCILRALYEAPRARDDVRIVAINSISGVEIGAHLTRYDSAHGRFGVAVEVDGDALVVGGDRIRFTAEADPAALPWRELGVDVVCECTGKFRKRASAAKHLEAGARKALISAPGDGADATIVRGVNDAALRPEHQVVSAASCTTNCLAPLAQALHEAVGIEHGLITTVHAYTGDQPLVDAAHKDFRRARAAAASIVPTGTGAATAVGLVLPELAGRLHGRALRVPTLNVSLVDLAFVAARPTSKDAIDAAVRAAADGRLAGVLEFCDEPLVSIDFNHNPASSVYDAGLTQVMGETFVKVCAWYDNEWAYACRMLELAVQLARA